MQGGGGDTLVMYVHGGGRTRYTQLYKQIKIQLTFAVVVVVVVVMIHLI